MSLLNDALKRAKEAQRPDTRASVSSLRSIEVRSPGTPLFSRVLVAVIFLLLAAAFAFIGLAMTGRLVKKNTVVSQTISAPPVSAPAAAARPVAAVAPSAPVQTAPTPAVIATVATVPPVKLAPAAAPVAAVVVVAPPPPPLVLPDNLHVQGVAYDPVRPWAIVSGRTVYVGDLVKGVRVMEITRNSVTFGSHGQTNLLFVGQ